MAVSMSASAPSARAARPDAADTLSERAAALIQRDILTGRLAPGSRLGIMELAKAYGLGATPLEVVWRVMLPYVQRSAIGAVMLGLGRALGETMAVTFIIGNSHRLPKSLFDSGSTIASTIANEFAEASTPMHEAALIALGLVLFLITFAVLALARALLGATRSY